MGLAFLCLLTSKCFFPAGFECLDFCCFMPHKLCIPSLAARLDKPTVKEECGPPKTVFVLHNVHTAISLTTHENNNNID